MAQADEHHLSGFKIQPKQLRSTYSKSLISNRGGAKDHKHLFDLDLEDLEPEELNKQIVNRLFVETRRQNKVVISINCTKAIETKRYQEMQDIAKESSRNIIPRTQTLFADRSLATANATGTHPKSQVAFVQRSQTNVTQLHNQSLSQNGIKMSQLLEKEQQLNKSRNPYQQDPNYLRPQSQIGTEKQAKSLNTRTFNQTSSQGNSTSFMARRNSQIKASESFKDQLMPAKADDKMNKSYAQISTNYSPEKTNMANYEDSSIYFPKPRQHHQTVMYNRAIGKLRNLLKQKGLEEKTFERNNFDVYHFHIESQEDNVELNKVGTYGIEERDNKSLNSTFIYGAGGSSLSLKKQRTVKYAESPQMKKIMSKTVQEKEQMISKGLLKGSPMLINKGQRNIQNFMMNLMEIDDSRSNLEREPSPFRMPIKVKTLLRITEVNDNEKDYIGMDIKDLQKLSKEELQIAYNRLFKSVHVLFSGAVDTLINRIDYKKVLHEQHMEHGHIKRKEQFHNSVEQSLITELRGCREQLEKKQLVHGVWSILEPNGCIPDSREGASAVIIDQKMYLCGGFSRDLFNDMRSYDLTQNRWKLFPNSTTFPLPRFTQVMVSYGKKIIIFGGAGQYIPSIKMRLSYNDIQIFDTERECWQKEPDQMEGVPKKRMNHTGALLGSVLLIHGGFNTEQKQVLDDFSLYDLTLMRWIQCRIFMNDLRIDDKLNSYNTINSRLIGFRHMHTLTAVYEKEYYEQTHGLKGNASLKAMWLQKRRFDFQQREFGENFNEGFYLFGGADQKGNFKNDLWFLEPNYQENEKHLSKYTYNFDRKEVLNLNMSRIENFSGRQPHPRIQHSATTFKDANNRHFLVIYGGRNDKIFADTKNVALNDICMFNINTNEWIALGMYGSIPCSRWAHAMCANSSQNSDGFVIIGGVNLQSYCKSKLYQFKFQSKDSRTGKDYVGNDELDSLQLHIKEKIEIVKELIQLANNA